MNGWQTVALGDVAIIERDSVSPGRIVSGTTYVGLEHIDSSGVFLDPTPVNAGELASAKFRFTRKHILYGKLRPYLTKIACPDFDGICSTDILPILPSDRIDRRFLFRYLRRPEMIQYANARTVGVNLPRLNPSVLAEVRIPLPPLDEQRRIAEILDRADELHAKRRAALAWLEVLKQSLFVELFGPPGSSPPSCEQLPFADSPVEIIDGDRGPAYPKSEEFLPTGYCLFLTAKNVTARGFDFSECQFISRERDEALREGKLVRGDVVLTTRGTLGNSAHYNESVPFEHVRINSGMLIFRAFLQKLRPEYLYIYLTSPHFVRQMQRAQSGSAQPQLPVRTLKNIKLLLPPLPQQDRCIGLFRAIDASSETLLRSAQKMSELFRVLQHRAFRGEL